MTELEEVKVQLKVLQSKLSFLEELEKTKSPVEIAYKKYYGKYPITDCMSGGDKDYISWDAFQMGYKFAQKDYKVGEYQEPKEEPKEPKTLYQMFCDRGWSEWGDELCDIVKEWMFQYDCDYATCKEYLEGYEECQTVLEERLR